MHNLQKKWRKRYDKKETSLTGIQLYIGSFCDERNVTGHKFHKVGRTERVETERQRER